MAIAPHLDLLNKLIQESDSIQPHDIALMINFLTKVLSDEEGLFTGPQKHIDLMNELIVAIDKSTIPNDKFDSLLGANRITNDEEYGNVVEDLVGYLTALIESDYTEKYYIDKIVTYLEDVDPRDGGDIPWEEEVTTLKQGFEKLLEKLKPRISSVSYDSTALPKWIERRLPQTITYTDNEFDSIDLLKFDDEFLKQFLHFSGGSTFTTVTDLIAGILDNDTYVTDYLYDDDGDSTTSISPSTKNELGKSIELNALSVNSLIKLVETVKELRDENLIGDEFNNTILTWQVNEFSNVASTENQGAKPIVLFDKYFSSNYNNTIGNVSASNRYKYNSSSEHYSNKNTLKNTSASGVDNLVSYEEFYEELDKLRLAIKGVVSFVYNSL
jgi:hypothetical protein